MAQKISEGVFTKIIDHDGLYLPDFSYFNNKLEKKKEKTSCLDQIQARINSRIKKWIQSSDPQFYISVDGLSGSGKTTLINLLDDLQIKYQNLFTVSKLPIELFITTERNSSNRENIIQSDDVFWGNVYNREKMKNVLQDIVKLGENDGVIHLPQAYQHTSGTFQPIDLKIRAGKKIVVIDGIDATNVADEAYLQEQRLNLFVFTSAEISLLSACVRDYTQKNVDLGHRLTFRIGEYGHLTEKLGETLLGRDDILVFDNTPYRTSMPKQVARFLQFKKKQIYK